MKYKGYEILMCEDGTLNVLDSSGELIDGGFDTYMEVEEYIDERE